MDIPGFEIIEALGSGGMATVYKARQISLDRLVAIKVLSGTQDSDDLRRFQEEARSEAKLKHSGIVQVYDANVEAGLPYIVMEFVDGYTVGAWIRRRKRLSEEDALLVAHHVSEALEYAWGTAGIIHCDIKPENVMIDFDGTVKVADLGLARTINAMSGEREEHDIMGTPAYMSPEQVRGDPDLDFRTDVYALGASLFHMVTGRMLFEGHEPARIMELQEKGQVPCVTTLCPDVSAATAALIERMLTKDRDARYADWRAVRMDIQRAKKKRLPVDLPQAEQMSTVEHGSFKTRVRVAAHAVARAPVRKATPRATLSISLAAILGIAGGVLLVHELLSDGDGDTAAPGEVPAWVPTEDDSADTGAPGHDGVEDDGAVEDPFEPALPPALEARAKRMIDTAVRWSRANPDAFARAERRIREALDTYPTSEHAARARAELKRIDERRTRRASEVLRQLQIKADALEAEGDLTGAVACYMNYSDLLAEETEAARLQCARELHAKQEAAVEAARVAEQERQAEHAKRLDDVVATLLKGDLEPAIAALDGASHLRPAEAATVKELLNVLREAQDVDRFILETFKKQLGSEITVNLASGPKRLRIAGTRGNLVQGVIETGVAGATAELVFGMNELSTAERWRRMVPVNRHGIALARGLMALGAGSHKHARACFEMTHPILATRLASSIEVEEEPAPVVEVPVQPDEHPVGAPLTQHEVHDLLARSNPDFNTAMASMTYNEEGHLVALAIEGPEFEDAADLGEFKALESLSLENTKVKRLVGLRGLALKRLVVVGDALDDVRGVDGQPLETLVLARTSIRRVDDLRGLRSLKTLDVSSTRIFDFSFLRNLSLEHLNVNNTQFRDVRLLGGMPLKSFRARGTRVSDVGPLASTPIEVLDLAGTSVKDLSPLRNKRLRYLRVDRTPVSDASMLNPGALKELYISDTRIKDLHFVRSLDLTGFGCRHVEGKELTNLLGQPIKRLEVDAPWTDDMKAILMRMPKLQSVNGLEPKIAMLNPVQRMMLKRQ